jgi:hypothetical protein
MRIRKGQLFLLFAAGAAVLIAILVFQVGSGQPRYHLRSISSWLAEYGEGPQNYKPSPKADHALRQMGSNAVPHVLKLLHSTNSRSHYTFVPKENRQRGLYPVMQMKSASSSLRDRWQAWSMNLRSRFQRVTNPASWDHWKAYLAFQALGPEATSAIPELASLARVPGTNSSPSGTGSAAPISFWKDMHHIPTFVAQSPGYVPVGRPVFAAPAPALYSGLVIQPFLSDGEIAAWSLAAIGADSVSPLMDMLTNNNSQLRVRAAIALGLTGKAAEPAVDELIRMLSDPDRDVRRVSADALGWIGQRPDLAVPALIRAFPDREVEFEAIIALGTMGEPASNAVPVLLKLLSDTKDVSLFHDRTCEQYRIGHAALALSRISSKTTTEEVIPFLISAMRSAESPWSRGMTISTLLQMTNQPDRVIHPLVEALGTGGNDPNLIYGLGEFGPHAEAAVPKLIQFSLSSDTNLCRLATNALDKIEPGWRNRH